MAAVDLVLHFDGMNVCFGEWDTGGLLPDVLGFAAGESIVPRVVHCCHGGAKSVVVSGGAGRLADFSVGDGVRVSHLLNADDALIFCGADSEQLGHLRCVLLCFKAVSGLKMNLAKSKLIPVGEVGHLLTLQPFWVVRCLICRCLIWVCLWGLLIR